MANTIEETFPSLNIQANKELNMECPWCGTINATHECKDTELKDVGVCCHCWQYWPIDEMDVLENDKKTIKTHKKSYGTVFGKANNII